MLNKIVLLLAIVSVTTSKGQLIKTPDVTGVPVQFSPDLLDWKTDFESKSPDLTEPTSNRIYDLHLQINDYTTFDLILSTSGNYHMALTEFWYDYFLPKYNIDNWFFQYQSANRRRTSRK